MGSLIINTCRRVLGDAVDTARENQARQTDSQVVSRNSMKKERMETRENESGKAINMSCPRLSPRGDSWNRSEMFDHHDKKIRRELIDAKQKY